MDWSLLLLPLCLALGPILLPAMVVLVHEYLKDLLGRQNQSSRR